MASTNQIQRRSAICSIAFINSVFSTPSSTPHSPSPSPTNSFSHLDISEDDVYRVLSTLDPNKSSGPDGISPSLLKYCAVALTVPSFCSIFTLRTNTFPVETAPNCNCNCSYIQVYLLTYGTSSMFKLFIQSHKVMSIRLLMKPYKFNVIWCHSCAAASFYEYNYFHAYHFLVSALCPILDRHNQ